MHTDLIIKKGFHLQFFSLFLLFLSSFFSIFFAPSHLEQAQLVLNRLHYQDKSS